MTDHQPMPVKGYTPQSQSNVDLSNKVKEAEERVLRIIDSLEAEHRTNSKSPGEMGERLRFLATGKTDLQKGFMMVVRSIFNPQRISLPEDASNADPLPPQAG